MRYLIALLIASAAWLGTQAQTKVRGTVTDGELLKELVFKIIH